MAGALAARALRPAGRLAAARGHGWAVAAAAPLPPGRTLATMRAAVYREFRGPIAVEDVPRPSAPYDGVVVEVAANGVCRSDHHGWQGHDGDIRKLPHVPGHELAGVVAEVGPGVTRFKRGDRVVSPFILSCGTCGECTTAKRPTVCEDQLQPGFHMWGSYAQFVALPRADRNLAPLAPSVAFAAGASLGCRFGTAYRAVAVRGAPQPGEWLCVLGCGGLGLAAVAVGKALGARVAACDVRAGALQRALDLGADVAVDAADGEALREQVREATGGGAHVAVDCAGWAATSANAVRALRRGGRMVQVGIPVGEEADPRIPMALVMGWELTLLGAHGFDAQDMGGLLEMVDQGRVQPERLVTAHLSLGQACHTLMSMGSRFPDGVEVITDFSQ